MPKNRHGENVGPTGGHYPNEANVLDKSGETHPTEAKSATGLLMSYMPVSKVTRNEGASHQASEKEMRGGNV